MLTLRRFNQKRRHCVLLIFSVPSGMQKCLLCVGVQGGRNVEKHCYGLVMSLPWTPKCKAATGEKLYHK